MKESKSTLIIYLVFAMVLCTAINVLITKTLQSKQLEVIVERLNAPTMMVFDMEKQVESFLEKDMSPEDVLAQIDNLNKAMHHQNILLIDKKAAVSIPERYQLKEITKEALLEYLNANSIVPSTPEAFKQNVQAVRSQLDVLTNGN